MLILVDLFLNSVIYTCCAKAQGQQMWDPGAAAWRSWGGISPRSQDKAGMPGARLTSSPGAAIWKVDGSSSVDSRGLPSRLVCPLRPWCQALLTRAAALGEGGGRPQRPGPQREARAPSISGVVGEDSGPEPALAAGQPGGSVPGLGFTPAHVSSR